MCGSQELSGAQAVKVLSTVMVKRTLSMSLRAWDQTMKGERTVERGEVASIACAQQHMEETNRQMRNLVESASEFDARPWSSGQTSHQKWECKNEEPLLKRRRGFHRERKIADGVDWRVYTSQERFSAWKDSNFHSSSGSGVWKLCKWMLWFPLSSWSFIPHEIQVVLESQEVLLTRVHWQSASIIRELSSWGKGSSRTFNPSAGSSGRKHSMLLGAHAASCTKRSAWHCLYSADGILPCQCERRERLPTRNPGSAVFERTHPHCDRWPQRLGRQRPRNVSIMLRKNLSTTRRESP